MSRSAKTEKMPDLQVVGTGALLTFETEVDVNDETALVNAFSGFDVVVHAAGTVDPYGSRESMFFKKPT